MITNFEEFTEILTDKEKKQIPYIIELLWTATKEHQINGAALCASVNFRAGEKVLTPPRLRKITNFIRSNSIFPLIATSIGYYRTDNKEEIKEQIKSLTERADAILNSARGLQKFL